MIFSILPNNIFPFILMIKAGEQTSIVINNDKPTTFYKK